MPEKRSKQYILCCLLLSWATGLWGQFTPQQLQWLESEQEHPAQVVNEGELVFIPTKAVKSEHHQSMHITLTRQSIATGWAEVSQCHENLDRVEKLEIVFHPQRIRKLQVTEFQQIKQAWSEGDRVIVRQVQAGSRICLRAESRVFHPLKHQGMQAQFEMVNGPFMRRFLDGYYPLNLSLQVNYPDAYLQLLDVHPSQQPGWQIRYDAGQIFLKGRFEGKLFTRLRFAQTGKGMQQ
ncbi:MAG: hypothetical protein OQL16_12170 [Gammaproteobacteria bacterium]|nr:hypothetical protein [Gammaproteobacteria bacterium]